MGTIGLRYPPASGTDPQQHAAQLALLASDVAHVPTEYLDRAAKDWAVKSPYMPKASDLIGLAQGYFKPENGQGYGSQAYIDRANNNISVKDAEWFHDVGGNMQLRATYAPRPRDMNGDPVPDAGPMTDAQIRSAPQWIINLGIKVGDLDADYCERVRRA